MKQTTILITLLLLCLPITLAQPTITWITPQQNGEYLTDTPTTIRAYINATTPIINCTLTVNSMNYTLYNINLKAFELQRTITIPSGTYTATTNCSDAGGSNTNSIQFNTDDQLIYQVKSERNFNYNLYLAIFLTLIVIYLLVKNWLVKTLISIALLIGSYLALSITQQSIMWIPITISAVLTIYQLFIKGLR